MYPSGIILLGTSKNSLLQKDAAPDKGIFRGAVLSRKPYHTTKYASAPVPSCRKKGRSALAAHAPPLFLRCCASSHRSLCPASKRGTIAAAKKKQKQSDCTILAKRYHFYRSPSGKIQKQLAGRSKSCLYNRPSVSPLAENVARHGLPDAEESLRSVSVPPFGLVQAAVRQWPAEPPRCLRPFPGDRQCRPPKTLLCAARPGTTA